MAINVGYDQSRDNTRCHTPHLARAESTYLYIPGRVSPLSWTLSTLLWVSRYFGRDILTLLLSRGGYYIKASLAAEGCDGSMARVYTGRDEEVDTTGLETG